MKSLSWLFLFLCWTLATSKPVELENEETTLNPYDGDQEETTIGNRDDVYEAPPPQVKEKQSDEMIGKDDDIGSKVIAIQHEESFERQNPFLKEPQKALPNQAQTDDQTSIEKSNISLGILPDTKLENETTLSKSINNGAAKNTALPTEETLEAALEESSQIIKQILSTPSNGSDLRPKLELKARELEKSLTENGSDDLDPAIAIQDPTIKETEQENVDNSGRFDIQGQSKTDDQDEPQHPNNATQSQIDKSYRKSDDVEEKDENESNPDETTAGPEELDSDDPLKETTQSPDENLLESGEYVTDEPKKVIVKNPDETNENEFGNREIIENPDETTPGPDEHVTAEPKNEIRQNPDQTAPGPDEHVTKEAINEERQSPHETTLGSEKNVTDEPINEIRQNPDETTSEREEQVTDEPINDITENPDETTLGFEEYATENPSKDLEPETKLKVETLEETTTGFFGEETSVTTLDSVTGIEETTLMQNLVELETTTSFDFLNKGKNVFADNPESSFHTEAPEDLMEKTTEILPSIQNGDVKEVTNSLLDNLMEKTTEILPIDQNGEGTEVTKKDVEDLMLKGAEMQVIQNEEKVDEETKVEKMETLETYVVLENLNFSEEKSVTMADDDNGHLEITNKSQNLDKANSDQMESGANLPEPSTNNKDDFLPALRVTQDEKPLDEDVLDNEDQMISKQKDIAMNEPLEETTISDLKSSILEKIDLLNATSQPKSEPEEQQANTTEPLEDQETATEPNLILPPSEFTPRLDDNNLDTIKVEKVSLEQQSVDNDLILDEKITMDAIPENPTQESGEVNTGSNQTSKVLIEYKDELDESKLREGRRGTTSASLAKKKNLPVILHGPNTIHLLKPKEPFVLICQAQVESGNVTYSWLKNGRPFHLNGKGGTQVFRESPFDGNIIFVAPGLQDTGTYQCVAENSFGKVFSHPSLVMNQKQKQHKPRELDIFYQRVDPEEEDSVSKNDIFVVLPMDESKGEVPQVLDMTVMPLT